MLYAFAYNPDFSAKLSARGLKPSLDRVLTQKFENAELNRGGIKDWYDADVFINMLDNSQK